MYVFAVQVIQAGGAGHKMMMVVEGVADIYINSTASGSSRCCGSGVQKFALLIPNPDQFRVLALVMMACLKLLVMIEGGGLKVPPPYFYFLKQ